MEAMRMEITISKSVETKKWNKHWKFCVGSGHAGLAMRTDYVKQLKYIHDELGIERVRFHGIFCEDMHTLHTLTDVLPLPGGDSFVERSFRLCGLVYDNVLACGMKPFVELSFMPPQLAASDKKGTFYYKPNISMPASDDAWIAYIKDFLNYLIRRYGKEEVEQWYFEVWNEPDLVMSFFDGTQHDYFHLYEITVRAIKEIDGDIMVGGPSTSGSKWISEFVSFCKDSNVPVDFISTHQYAGDPLGGVTEGTGEEPIDYAALYANVDFGKILATAENKTLLAGFRSFLIDKSETEDLPDNIFRTNAPIVRAKANGLPVFYTEWNANAIFSASTNDTRKVAAYDLKTALDISEDVDGSSIWCFSDIFEEAHPFAEEFHGGFGILTQHGIPKPVFYALKMLNDVSDDRMLLQLPDGQDAMRGEVSIAGFKNEYGVQLLLTRQRMKNEKLTPKQVIINLELDNEPLSVSLKRIDEVHCNPLQVWKDMGSPMDLTPVEVESIKDKSALTVEELHYEYANEILTVKVELEINDVFMIEVKKGR
jgi:xylan 1,4-beta-xylosidase